MAYHPKAVGEDRVNERQEEAECDSIPSSMRITLQTKMMYLCIMNHDGEIVLHRNLKTDPKAFLAAIMLKRKEAFDPKYFFAK